jgi:hypothetical protein
MEDTTTNLLSGAKNDWAITLINYVTPHIMDGFRSIFNESVQLCDKNEEPDKYLMTFQNLLTRIPKWNQQTIDLERERITKLCNCAYIEELVACVHIIQLKILSCVRVGNETKKLDIDIPDFGLFIHQVYINVARKLYSAIYLFEIDISGLEKQKRTREFELLVQICIMNTIRDKIPIEALLRQYIDESTEYITKEPDTIPPVVVKEIPEVKPPPVPEIKPPDEIIPFELDEIKPMDLPDPQQKISFNPEIETFNLPPSDPLEEVFNVGEDVPIHTLCFDEIENNDPIDLGIVEL